MLYLEVQHLCPSEKNSHSAQQSEEVSHNVLPSEETVHSLQPSGEAEGMQAVHDGTPTAQIQQKDYTSATVVKNNFSTCAFE